MNKKSARKISQRRRKVCSQNERAYWRGVERQKIISDFKIHAISEDRREWIVETCEEDEECLLCASPVDREQIKNQQFLVFEANRNQSSDYFVHSGHLLEADGETKKNAAEIMQTVWILIAEREIGGELKKFDRAVGQTGGNHGEKL